MIKFIVGQQYKFEAGLRNSYDDAPDTGVAFIDDVGDRVGVSGADVTLVEA